ncbi:MAG: LacI family DNA-binding transcriptional regulator [Acidimicrobiales bacterium]
MAPKRRPTSHDVARVAGVSRATVSYVLNDVTRQRISPQVRQRVWKAVEELHYTPHHHARMLKTKETDIVLIVMVGATPGPVLTQVTDNLTRRVAAAGYTPLIDYTGAPSPTAFTRACERMQPVAVVAPGALLSPRIVKTLELNGTRCVLAVGDGPGKSIARLRYSEESVGEAAATFLIERGRKRVLAVMPDDPRLADIAASRLGGLRRVLDGRRLRSVTVPMDLDAARDLILSKVHENPAIDAAFVYNDEYAMIVLHVLRDAGIAVPDDIAVMGCDNLHFAALTQPSLTTIDLGDLGGQIADFLLGMLEGRRRSAGTMGTATVIPRESA